MSATIYVVFMYRNIHTVRSTLLYLDHVIGNILQAKPDGSLQILFLPKKYVCIRHWALLTLSSLVFSTTPLGFVAQGGLYETKLGFKSLFLLYHIFLQRKARRGLSMHWQWAVKAFELPGACEGPSTFSEYYLMSDQHVQF